MNDTIYRQAAIDEAKHYIETGYDSDIIHTLENLPSAQPERKKGKWIYDGQYQYHCSNCGEYIYGDADATPDINKFCWNCGADMRGAEK